MMGLICIVNGCVGMNKEVQVTRERILAEIDRTKWQGKISSTTRREEP